MLKEVLEEQDEPILAENLWNPIVALFLCNGDICLCSLVSNKTRVTMLLPIALQ